MQINWKFLAVFGGAGFFLSFLVGLISRAGFGRILFRGLISGALFAGVGFGILFLIKKYLPGLASESEAEEPGSEGIDIVIEDEEPTAPLRAAGRQRRASSPAEDSDIVRGDDQDDEEPSNAFVEEVEERSGETLQEDEEEEISISEPEEDLIDVADNVNIDSLPDITDFSGSFSRDTEEEEESEEGNDSELSSLGAARKNRSETDQDPEIIAKAIKTMLKKDTE